MTIHDADSGIPLLTEVLPVEDDDDLAHDIAALLAPPMLLEVSASKRPLPDLPESQREPDWSEQDLARLQAEISDRITHQVLRRIDLMLEQRVRDSLADVLQLAVSGMAQSIRHDLKQTLEEAISRTVAQELSHFQSKNNPL
ncbi:MAG: protein required for attachment to host cells [Candidatus Paceibacteria bacterium]|jgi:protein required for attachment to host cells